MLQRIYLRERVLFIGIHEILSYKKGELIYRSKTNGITQRFRIGSFINRFSIVERVMRKEPRCAVKVGDSQFVISFDGMILKYIVDNNTCIIEHYFDKGMKNPLDFTAVDNNEGIEVYYGEYIWNDNNGPVAIYKRTLSGWDKVYEFPPNRVKHIHAIIDDKYRKGFIILTGDSDSESGIWFSDYEFKSVRPIAVGKQKYRACVAFPVENGIIYATDTPLEKNYIYYLKLDNSNKMVDLIKQYDMPGPCIYGTDYKGDFYFSTSVEPDSTLPTWRYRITHRLGKGVTDRFTHIIHRDKDGEYSEVMRIRKDICPMWLFQFGNILFPKNESNRLYAVIQATILGHGFTIKL